MFHNIMLKDLKVILLEASKSLTSFINTVIYCQLNYIIISKLTSYKIAL